MMDKSYQDFICKLLTDMETFLTLTLSETELQTAAEESRIEILKQIETLRQKTFPESQEYVEMNGNIPSKDIIITDPVEEYVNEYVNEDADASNELSKSCPNSSETCYQYALQQDKRVRWPLSFPDDPLPLGQINPPSAPALKAMASKCGPLQRKDRFMFMEQFRRLWVAYHGNHLYFYGSEKDNKPQYLLDISEYTARHAPEATRDSKKKPLCFEITCPGNKAQQFIARTPKDMEQWVSVITRVKNRCSVRNATYDDAADTKCKSQRSKREVTQGRCISEDNEDAIYHDIQDGILPENLYDDAVGKCVNHLSYEEDTYDDVGAWREKLEEIRAAASVDEPVETTAVVAEETGGAVSGIRLTMGGSRIRELVRFMEEEGVIKGDECGRRKDEGGGVRNMEDGKDH